MCSDAIISKGKKQTNGEINVANLPIFNNSANYREGQKVKVKGFDGKWYVGTVKANGGYGTGYYKRFEFVPDNPEAYKRGTDVNYNYNIYKESVFERAQRSNDNPTAQQIQGKIVHDAPWPYKLKALNDYVNTPNDFIELKKSMYLIDTEQYGFDPEVNEQYAQLSADITVGMMFENGMTCGIVGKRGMSEAVAGSGAGNIKKGGSKSNNKKIIPPSQVNGGKFDVEVPPARFIGDNPVSGAHNATVKIIDKDDNIVNVWREVSGNATESEKALGVGRMRQATHTEQRALTRMNLSDETVLITGQNPPCRNCQGAMRQATSNNSATIIYQWREKGQTYKAVWKGGKKIKN